MDDVLAEICAAKRKHIATRRSLIPLANLETEVEERPATRGFQSALEAKAELNQLPLIAEIKKASPSRGLIRADFEPAELAQAYADGGAACLSVLTDTPYFQGHDAYLDQARQAVTMPVLRKDFMLDPYQIFESRVLGADCILLIMACLSPKESQDLAKLAFDLGMDVLAEAHDEKELDQALTIDGAMIGINNRNLKTLQVSLSTFETLARDVPFDRFLVAESGMSVHGDLLRLSEAGSRAFLIGESLMRQPDVSAATRQILGL